MVRIFSVLALALIGWLIYIIVDQDQRLKQKDNALELAYRTAVFWKDKHNHSNAEIGVLKLDKKTLVKTHNKIVDSLKKEGIKIRNTKSVVNVTVTTTDTISVSKPQFSSRWSSYNWLDSTTLIHISRDSLALITHHKKYGFLNLKSKYVTRAISYNPHTILTGLTSIEITPVQRRISLVGYSGYGLTVAGGDIYTGWQAGIGIGYRIF